jgi:hypothetical protein
VAPNPAHAWWRFSNVTVSAGATIDVAYLTLTVLSNVLGSVMSNIAAIDEDDHTAPTNQGEWDTDHAAHTTAVVTWDFESVAAPASQQTPSLVAIIQEIIDRAGWASGQAIGIHIDNDGTVADPGNTRQVWVDVEGTPNEAILHIEYTVVEPTAVVTGTAVSGGVTEAEIVAGGETLIITLTDDTWVATVGDDNAITDALIAGITSAGSEAFGWTAEVRDNMVFGDVTRTSDTVVTVTLAAEAVYAITTDETITVTIPATALTAAGEVVATPTFDVTNEIPSASTLMLLGVG